MKLKEVRKNLGFTLAELLVVIAIVAVLASISTPIVFRRVSAANATIAQSNAKDIYKGVIEYALNNGKFAPVEANANLSMRPYFEAQSLYDETPFFIKETEASFPGFSEGDGDLTALEPGANVFSYYGATTGASGGWNPNTSPARAPLLATPVPTTAGTSYGTMRFGADFPGYGVILNISGGADRISLGPTGEAVNSDGISTLKEPTDISGAAVSFFGTTPAAP